MRLPLRRDDLVIRQLDEEMLLYDRKLHKAHCLNRAAALVWEHCDGRATVAEMATLLRRRLDWPEDQSVVRLALAELRQANLLQPEPGDETERYSRRDLARKLGVALVLVPAVMTIVAPSVAMAASTISPPECNDPGNIGKCCFISKNNRRLCVAHVTGVSCVGPVC